MLPGPKEREIMAKDNETETRKVRLTIECSRKHLTGEALALFLVEKLEAEKVFDAVKKITVDEKIIMDRESIEADYPDLFDQLRAVE